VPVEQKYSIVDVFADEPLTGNPLAVVPDADGLSDARMRAIAREFNLSETTFLVRPADPAADWRLRSFTPGGAEVGGAGHNALGAWIWLAESGRVRPSPDPYTQQIGGDLLPVSVTLDGQRRVLVSMEQSPPVFGATAGDRTALAAGLGLAPGDLSGAHPAQVVSTGAGHLLIEAVSRDAVDRASPDGTRLLPVLQAAGGEGAYLYCLDPLHPESGAVAYARFFNPTVGIAEDPATGTAAGPLVAALIARGIVPDGGSAVIEQGYRMGRPSRIRIDADGPRVRIAGRGLVVADGTLHL
jgi:trans-2,3-dihydro-3-hydroxyanthranilate isomerase